MRSMSSNQMKAIELLINKAEHTFEDANYLFFDRKSYESYAEISESIANEVLKDTAKFIGRMKQYLIDNQFLEVNTF